MSSVYTPVGAPLTTITVPSDGDLRNVASVNGPMKKLADALVYGQLHPSTCLLAADVSGQAGSTGGPLVGAIIAPGDCYAMYIEGCGGGGGGGKGGPAGTPATTTSTGGAGGGGARRQGQLIAVTPSLSYTYFIPSPAAPGANGGDLVVITTVGVVEVYRARGGAGGPQGSVGGYSRYRATSVSTGTTETMYGFTPGGADVYTPNAPAVIAQFTPILHAFYPRVPQFGGCGLSFDAANTTLGSGFAGNGAASPEGKTGGVAGVSGLLQSADYLGGGSGGGGGAGPYGAGGNGGNGSDAVNSGNPLVGGVGSDGPAGSGAGGGGGGGAGSASGSSTPGGVGGYGGSARIRIWFLHLKP